MDPTTTDNNAAAAAGKRKAAEVIIPLAAELAGDYSHQPPSYQKAIKEKKSKPILSDEAKVQLRLEANRKAARESRRRKKVLVEELQRSVVFFSRANGKLKQKNEELEHMLVAAHNQIAVRNGQVAAAVMGGNEQGQVENDSFKDSLLKHFKKDGRDGDIAAEEDNSSVDFPLSQVDPFAVGEQAKADASQHQQQQQQQQQITTIPIPAMAQQPIPFASLPGVPQAGSNAGAMVMDPNTMMYMMMMAQNPIMVANPMLAVQMLNQFQAMTGAGAPIQHQQNQGQAGVPVMPASVDNVIMPTPGGAFNPFLGAGQQQGFTAALDNNVVPHPASAAPSDGGSSSVAAEIEISL